MFNEYNKKLDLYKSFEENLQEVLRCMKDNPDMYEKSLKNLMPKFRKIIEESENFLNELKEKEKRIEEEREMVEYLKNADNKEYIMMLNVKYDKRKEALENEYRHKIKNMPQHRIRKDGTSSMKRNFTLENHTKKAISELALKSNIKSVVEDAIRCALEVKESEMNLYTRSGEKKEQLVVWLDSEIDKALVERCKELNMKYNIFLENALRYKYNNLFFK